MKLTGATGFAADTDDVSTTAKHPLGTIAYDAYGNKYKYMLGVGSTVAGSAVSYDEAYATALLAANAIGGVAVAMAAIVASRYGWYCVDGYCTVATHGAVADNKPLYIGATAGTVDDAAVAGDCIFGAVSRSAAGGAGTITAQLFSPYVVDGAYLT